VAASRTACSELETYTVVNLDSSHAAPAGLNRTAQCTAAVHCSWSVEIRRHSSHTCDMLRSTVYTSYHRRRVAAVYHTCITNITHRTCRTRYVRRRLTRLPAAARALCGPDRQMDGALPGLGGPYDKPDRRMLS